MVDERNKLEVKSIVELIGAAAVLIGLIFVGLELRQNTAAVEAATLQNLTDASVDWIVRIVEDPELTRIFMSPPGARDSLTAVEAQRLHLLIRAQWLRFQNAYLQWQRGTLSDEDWSLYEGFVCTVDNVAAENQTASGWRVVTWDEHREILLTPFVEFVERCRSSD